MGTSLVTFPGSGLAFPRAARWMPIVAPCSGLPPAQRHLGGSNTSLDDAAFRPGCDGGLIVGGETDFRGSRDCGGTL